MLNLDDKRWAKLDGGYRMRYDPRSTLTRLYADLDTVACFSELWDNLHHQGDVGEASYASVPHLVSIYSKRKRPDWNFYAIVSIIELARTDGNNPVLPEWLADSHFSALQELARIGVGEIFSLFDLATIRGILSILAITKGLRAHGKLILNYSEDELAKMKWAD